MEEESKQYVHSLLGGVEEVVTVKLTIRLNALQACLDLVAEMDADDCVPTGDRCQDWLELNMDIVEQLAEFGELRGLKPSPVDEEGDENDELEA